MIKQIYVKKKEKEKPLLNLDMYSLRWSLTHEHA